MTATTTTARAAHTWRIRRGTATTRAGVVRSVTHPMVAAPAWAVGDGWHSRCRGDHRHRAARRLATDMDPRRPLTSAGLAERVLASPPLLGGTRLVCIDGPA